MNGLIVGLLTGAALALSAAGLGVWVTLRKHRPAEKLSRADLLVLATVVIVQGLGLLAIWQFEPGGTP